MLQNLLVVCIGNICRSPMAEAAFKAKVFPLEPKINVSSAGLAALIGHSADIFAQELMLEKGLNIVNHRARQISIEILNQADLILTMSHNQRKTLEIQYPQCCGKTYRLGEWEGYDIPDPFQRPKLAFNQAFNLIEQGTKSWCKKLWNL